MMSDFKVPVAAAVLFAVQIGEISLKQEVKLTPAERVPGSAVQQRGRCDSGFGQPQ